ncbi:hypothetical protein F3Y22_tig00111708pilonHSYRG00239 [Hibiscus syriacus]|uniref:Uncharacterized protein n=1 Tax=Hibiscus syriacus TaxID=106335 RepID=A0A6A2YI75_HIBSY|nr:uncharacterized protein LOC120168054 [Hibiscus syriacus]KAE8674914.1 hypothetical protein F3Y22_tig00111708pilonHSYRG00239 [Hibiscus syriacus]
MNLKNSSHSQPTTARKGRNYGGMVGSYAAECTAVACCFPLAMVDMLFLGLYRVPAGLCKKAIGKKKRNRQNLGLHPTTPVEDLDRMVKGKLSGENEVDRSKETVDPEEKLMEELPRTGFWREPSGIETYDVPAATRRFD